MSKAEDIALSTFPVLKTELGDINYLPRISFIEGYHQAEKDMELTWEDIETIGELRLNVALELRRKELESPIKAPLKFTTEDMCKEVLKQFKEKKENG